MGGGGVKFPESRGLPSKRGGSLRGSFGGLRLRGSLGIVFEVTTPHLREADRDPYIDDTVFLKHKRASLRAQ